MRSLTILFFFFAITNIRAEKYYCWSISGSNVRESPSTTGKIIGKVDYGQQVNIDLSNQDFSHRHEEIFLLGIDKGDDIDSNIKIEGYWFSFELNNRLGYIYSGYLSRFPTFKLKKTDNEITSESYGTYLPSYFKLLNSSIEVWDSSYHDNKIRTFLWEGGIMVIDNNSEKGRGATLVFADMTMNEAVLFIKFEFNIFDQRIAKDRSKLSDGDDFYGVSSSYDEYMINWPAPSGSINIRDLGGSILITFWGSC